VPPYVRPMLVNCPSCNAAYDVPDRLLAAGPRRMKCAKCGHQFSAALAQESELPPASSVAVDPPAEATAPTSAAPLPRSDRPAGSAIKPVEAQPARAKPDRLALLGWVATLLLLLGSGGFVSANHTELAQAWPPVERLFAQLGLDWRVP